MTTVANIIEPATPLAQSIKDRIVAPSGPLKKIASGRSDVYMINPFYFKVQDGFNARNFENQATKDGLQLLAKSIAKTGVKKAVIARRVGDDIVLIDGERRLRATMIAINEYGADIRSIPCVFSKANDQQAVMDMILSNEGEPLSPLDKAAGLARLVAFGWSINDIAEEAALSVARVNQLLDLNRLGGEVRSLINDDSISATLALDIARANNFDESKTLATIKSAQSNAQSNGKTRVTKKSVDPADVQPKKVAVKAALAEIFDKADTMDEDGVVSIVISREDWDKVTVLLNLGK